MKMVKSITEKQLTKINEQQRNVTTVLTDIGVLEAQKMGLIQKLAELNGEVELFKKQLKDEYGDIRINLHDGSYTLEEEEAELEAVSE
jgi:hypothetical protein